MLRSALSRAGYKVFESSGLAEAVDVLGRHAADVEFALIDLHMPGGNGVETALALKSINPGLACCLMGGDVAAGEDVPEPFARVLPKPFTLPDVMDALRATQ